MAGLDVSAAVRAYVYALTDGHCWYCGSLLIPGAMQIDHLVSTRAGGPHKLGNLVPSCQPCNSAKGKRSLEAFRTYRALGDNSISERVLEVLDAIGSDARAQVEATSVTFRFYFERMGLDPMRLNPGDFNVHPNWAPAGYLNKEGANGSN